MSRKHQLRKQRAGTVINLTSKKQESRVGKALLQVIPLLETQFKLQLQHDTQWKLKDIVKRLSNEFGDVEFHYHQDTSAMKPDGGILSLVASNSDVLYPILITEVKNQGTNDLRMKEGLGKQSKGNAIERLGKNVIGFRTALTSEGIVPFVCFGDGCDFADGSSILDRVTTIAMFGKLNKICVVNEGPEGVFNRGSFFFRHPAWTSDEMSKIMTEVASRSIHYYLAKYGSDYFKALSLSEGR